MTDHLTPLQRSALMRRIRGSDTLPERLLSNAFTELGARHTRNDKTIPGTPDIALRRLRVAVFVHGCFWHGCPVHYRPPKTRQAFWHAKLQRTKSRDRRVRNSLRMVGWRVEVVWEHEAKRNPIGAAKRILQKGVSPKPGNARKKSPWDRLRVL